MPFLIAGFNFTDGNETDSQQYTKVQQLAVTFVLSFIVMAAVGGNTLIICTFSSHRSLRRKVSNRCFLSLALANLLTAVSVMPFSIILEVSGQWFFGDTFCVVWVCLDVALCTASILNICLICIDRHLQLMGYFYAGSRLTSLKVNMLIVMAWLISFMVSFLPINMGLHQSPSDRRSEPHAQQCSVVFSFEYSVISSTVSFYVPCAIVVVLNVRAFVVTRQHVRVIKKEFQTATKHSVNKTADVNATFTVGLVVFTFIFCWLPFFVANPIVAACPGCIPPTLFYFFIWLGYANTCVHPIILSIMNKGLRQAYRHHRKKIMRRAAFGSGRKTKISRHGIQTTGETIDDWRRFRRISTSARSTVPELRRITTGADPEQIKAQLPRRRIIRNSMVKMVHYFTAISSSKSEDASLTESSGISKLNNFSDTPSNIKGHELAHLNAGENTSLHEIEEEMDVQRPRIGKGKYVQNNFEELDVLHTSVGKIKSEQPIGGLDILRTRSGERKPVQTIRVPTEFKINVVQKKSGQSVHGELQTSGDIIKHKKSSQAVGDHLQTGGDGRTAQSKPKQTKGVAAGLKPKVEKKTKYSKLEKGKEKDPQSSPEETVSDNQASGQSASSLTRTVLLQSTPSQNKSSTSSTTLPLAVERNAASQLSVVPSSKRPQETTTVKAVDSQVDAGPAADSQGVRGK